MCWDLRPPCSAWRPNTPAPRPVHLLFSLLALVIVPESAQPWLLLGGVSLFLLCSHFFVMWASVSDSYSWVAKAAVVWICLLALCALTGFGMTLMRSIHP